MVLGAAALIGLALIAVSFAPRRPLLVWNFTASAPVGLYRALDRPWRRGDWAAVRPSPELAAMLARFGALERDRLLVKRIVGVEGDQVCRSGADVSVNGVIVARARTHTSAGNPLPDWQGCQTLSGDQVFLLGEAEASFDGRYFGATAATEIVAPLVLVTAINHPNP